MPIKISTLEQKRYYRIAKVFFLVFPLLVAAWVFLSGYIDISGISQKNIVSILQKNSNYVVYAVVGLVFYYIILSWTWKSFLYIAFGGLEDDTQKKSGEAVQSANPPGTSGVSDALAERSQMLIVRVGLVPEFSISGGIAKNEGIVKRIERNLKVKAYIAPEPQIVGALGAALYAQKYATKVEGN